MHKERVSENVYWFQSDIYAQATAGAVIGPQWSVLIDTLMPQETHLIKQYLENDLMSPVRYIINSHHHADHSWGNCIFPNATVIGHALCRKFMIERSTSALDEAGQDNPFFHDICITPPHITFSEGTLSLKVGKKQMLIFSTPGHSADGVSVLLEEDRILFAGDAFMPVPFVVGGDIEELEKTMLNFTTLGLENIIQGHGDIILRGEIDETAHANISYLRNLQKLVRTASRRKFPLEFLKEQDVESSGKARVTLGGLAQGLHQKNLLWLYMNQAAESAA